MLDTQIKSNRSLENSKTDKD